MLSLEELRRYRESELQKETRESELDCLWVGKAWRHFEGKDKVLEVFSHCKVIGNLLGVHCCRLLPRVVTNLGFVFRILHLGPSWCVMIWFLFISFSTLYFSPEMRMEVAQELESHLCCPWLNLKDTAQWPAHRNHSMENGFMNERMELPSLRANLPLTSGENTSPLVSHAV